MKIAVVGTGYVGLVTGTCLAETGNDVVCVDRDRKKIDTLCRGELPIYEPGLDELVKRNMVAGRLSFSLDLSASVVAARLIFLTVGTPPNEDGSVDLSGLWDVVESIASHLARDAVVILKSTVPVGTSAAVAARLKELTGRDCDVASNPEFLKEGTSIEDFMKPDRVVVGVRRQEVLEILTYLYEPYLRTDKPLLAMTPESSEMTKYVANSLLATKISFINEIANVCERTGADINDVRRGIGHDSRIGFAFLFPGVGYGGSCFPKDVRALAAIARAHGAVPEILDAIHAVNVRQKNVLYEKMDRHFQGQLSGKTFALWGLAFKPGTDDIREAPAVSLIERLLASGAALRVYDPQAADNVRQMFGDRLTYCADRDEVLQGADALAILTDWKEFVHPDFDRMRSFLHAPLVFDGRNLYSPQRMKDAGFTYHSIGRATARPA